LRTPPPAGTLVPSEHRSFSRKEKAVKKEDPLILRMHSQAHLYELVWLVGYEGAAVDALREAIKPLVAAHGQAKMMAAAHELTQTDDKTKLVTLRPEVRRIAFQLLGPPPEREDYESYWASRGVLPPNKRKKEGPAPEPSKEPEEKPKKRARKKAAK
jgi:hypothetical protein